jgi:hypothetical protein
VVAADLARAVVRKVKVKVGARKVAAIVRKAAVAGPMAAAIAAVIAKQLW